MTWRRCTVGLALAAVLAAPAFAGVDSGARRRVAAHKRAAFRRLEAGAYGAAIEEMRAAHEILPHPGFLLNIAVAYVRWGGHCRDAFEAFDAFRDACEDCDMRDAGEERREEAVAACEVVVPVRTRPSGADVLVDGTPAGEAPLDLHLLPGPHRVVARLEGYAPSEQGFEVAEGVGPSLVLELIPLEDRRPPAAPSPATAVAPASGPGAGPWVALGAGVAGLGAGAALTAHTLSVVDREAEARADGAEPDAVLDLRAEAETSAILAHVGYGVGVAGVGLALLLWALDGDDAPVAAWGAGSSAGGRVRF
jgi:hypothetical protein